MVQRPKWIALRLRPACTAAPVTWASGQNGLHCAPTHTHPLGQAGLATLPTFGNLAKGKAASFWQRCQLLATLANARYRKNGDWLRVFEALVPILSRWQLFSREFAGGAGSRPLCSGKAALIERLQGRLGAPPHARVRQRMGTGPESSRRLSPFFGRIHFWLGCPVVTD